MPRKISVRLALSASVFFVHSISSASGINLSGLLENSPFNALGRQKKPVEIQSQIELRGIVVENGITRFTFFDGNAKKWVTTTKGDADAFVQVTAFNIKQDTVTIAVDGKEMILAMGRKGMQSAGKALQLAANTKSEKVAAVSPVLLGPSPSESKRLELVSSAIRQHLEAAKRAIVSTPSSS